MSREGLTEVLDFESGEIDEKAIISRFEGLIKRSRAILSSKFPARDLKSVAGPNVVSLDPASSYGSFLLCKDGLSLESTSNFTSMRGNTCVYRGKWVYEVVLGTSGRMQIGWADISTEFTNSRGLGDSEYSFSYDGKNTYKWNNEGRYYGESWVLSDVISCCIDLDADTISFHRNGRPLGIAFNNIRKGTKIGFFPGASLSNGEKCLFRFGAERLFYEIEGFKPLQMQPTREAIRAFKILLNFLRKLVEFTARQPEKFMKSKSMFVRVFKDILTEIGEEITEPSFFIGSAVVPWLVSVLYKSERRNEENSSERKRKRKDAPFQGHIPDNFDHLLDVMHKYMPSQMFEQAMIGIIRSISLFSRTRPITRRKSESAYPYLVLAKALLSKRYIREVFMLNPDEFIDPFTELLCKKELSLVDLKRLVPDSSLSPLYNLITEVSQLDGVGGALFDIQEFKELSSNFSAMEEVQTQIAQSMLFDSEEIHVRDENSNGISPRSFFLEFVRFILVKNHKMNSLIPPPGLSDKSLLHFLYFFMNKFVKRTILRVGTNVVRYGAQFRSVLEEAQRNADDPEILKRASQAFTLLFDFETFFTREPTADLLSEYFRRKLREGENYTLNFNIARLGGSFEAIKRMDPADSGRSFDFWSNISEPDGNSSDSERECFSISELLSGKDNMEFECIGLDPEIKAISTDKTTVNEFLHLSLMLYNVDISTRCKRALHQLNQRKSYLLKYIARKYALQLIQPFFDYLNEIIRQTLWNCIVLFNEEYVSSMISQLDMTTNMVRIAQMVKCEAFPYLTEFYVSTPVDIFMIISLSSKLIPVLPDRVKRSKLDHREAKVARLEEITTKSVAGLYELSLCGYMDNIIVSPHLKSLFLRVIYASLSEVRYVKSVYKLPVTKHKLMDILIGCFDVKFDLAMNVLLRFWRGSGFLRMIYEDTLFTNKELQMRFREKLSASDDKSKFLTRLFEFINSAITEFSVTAKEISSSNITNEILFKKCHALLDILLSLLKLAEILAIEVPHILLEDEIHTIRIIEILMIVLSLTNYNKQSKHLLRKLFSRMEASHSSDNQIADVSMYHGYCLLLLSPLVTIIAILSSKGATESQMSTLLPGILEGLQVRTLKSVVARDMEGTSRHSNDLVPHVSIVVSGVGQDNNNNIFPIHFASISPLSSLFSSSRQENPDDEEREATEFEERYFSEEKTDTPQIPEALSTSGFIKKLVNNISFCVEDFEFLARFDFKGLLRTNAAVWQVTREKLGIADVKIDKGIYKDFMNAVWNIRNEYACKTEGPVSRLNPPFTIYI